MTINSRSPVVGKSNLSLIKPMNIQMECVNVELEVECEWLLDSETQVEYLHGGKVLKSGSCYNDFYGFLTCMDEEHGEEAVKEFSVSPDSSLEVRMITTVSVIPVQRTNESLPFGMQSFQEMETGLWHKVKADHQPLLLERVELLEVCSWSSKGMSDNIVSARNDLMKFSSPDYVCKKIAETLSEHGVEVKITPLTENKPAA